MSLTFFRRTITPRPGGASSSNKTKIVPTVILPYKPKSGSKPGNRPKHYHVQNTIPGGKTIVSTTNENGKKRTELPMGISCVSNGVFGTMSIIVEAKSALKDGINKSRTYYTHEDNQTSCTIEVTQYYLPHY